MATLTSSTGTSFRLRVVSYDDGLPPGAPLSDDYRANRLNIVAVANDGTRDWVLSGAWLTTWEIRKLILWLDAVAYGNFNLFSTFGIEPWPDFDVCATRDGYPAIRIETTNFNGSSREEVQILIEYNPAALRAFASELEDEVSEFPIRVVETGGSAHARAKLIASWRETKSLRTTVQRADRWPRMCD